MVTGLYDHGGQECHDLPFANWRPRKTGGLILSKAKGLRSMNSMKRQNDRILKGELPGSVVPNMLLEISGEITPERMKGWSQSKKNTSCGCDW